MAEFNYFEELKESLEDAVAFQKGDSSRCRTVVREFPSQASDNASAEALQKAQKAFACVAERLGIQNEDDVQSLVDEARHGRPVE